MNYKLKPVFAGLISAAIINLQGDETNEVKPFDITKLNSATPIQKDWTITNAVPITFANYNNNNYIPSTYTFDLLGLIVNTNGVLSWTNGVDNVTLQWQTNSYSDTPNQLYIMERVVKNRMLMIVKGGETNYLKGEQLGEILTNWIPVKVEYKK